MSAIVETLLGAFILACAFAIVGLVTYYGLGELVGVGLVSALLLGLAYALGHSLIGEDNDEDSHGV